MRKLSEEVAPGIHRIAGELGGITLATYALIGTRRTILYDSGTVQAMRKSILPALDELGVSASAVSHVILSHSDVDHMGGNAVARQAFPHASLACHAADRRLMEQPELIISERYERFALTDGIGDDPPTIDFYRSLAEGAPIDAEIIDGDVFALGDDWRVRASHLPGHSPGHLGLFDERSNTAIIGDAVLGTAMLNAAGERIAAPGYYDPGAYESTIRQLAQCNVDLLLTAHFPPMNRHEAAEFLAASASFVVQLEDALRSALTAGPGRTTRSLVRAVSRELKFWPSLVDMSAVYPVAGHLERMLELGLASVSYARGGVRRWILSEATH